MPLAAVSFNTGRARPCCDGPMNTPDFNAAAVFVAASARVIDRRRFQRLFEDGPASAVRDAVAAYRNEDGGFGHALEPDCRAPGSQPAATEMALRILDEAGAWDEDLVRGACDWLAAVAPAEGGAAFVETGPRAPGGLAARALVGPRGGASRLARRHRPDHGHAARPRLQPSLARRRHRGDVEPDRQARRGHARRDRRAATRCSACSRSSSMCPTGTGPARRSAGSAR